MYFTKLVESIFQHSGPILQVGPVSQCAAFVLKQLLEPFDPEVNPVKRNAMVYPFFQVPLQLANQTYIGIISSLLSLYPMDKLF